VYPGVEQFLAGWYASVRAQTDSEFDLWISADGLSRADAVAAMGGDPGGQWLIPPAGASPAALRSSAWQELARHYDGILLVDSDDLLEPNRVAAARAGLASADVVGCALRIADAAGTPLGPVLAPADSEPDWNRLLVRHNVFGLSNSAYRAVTLRACLPIPAQVVLIDWLLVLRAWGSGARLRFDPVPGMRYRQHAGNTARVLPPFSEDYVLRATDLVIGHYQHALRDADAMLTGPNERLRQAQADVTAFRRAVRGSAAVLGAYVAALNRLEPRYVWWWCVANPALEAVWSN
jgi:hypothetical protein